MWFHRSCLAEGKAQLRMMLHVLKRRPEGYDGEENTLAETSPTENKPTQKKGNDRYLFGFSTLPSSEQ